MNPKIQPSNGTILCGLRGSLAHGTFIPTTDDLGVDDEDYMSVVIAPLNCYIGLSEWGTHGRGTKETMEGSMDLVEYELQKFVRLLLKGNPNVQALLWLKEEHYLILTDFGRALIKNRTAFSSKKAFAPYLGYAHGQMSKMEKAIYKGFQCEKRQALCAKFGYDTKHAAHAIRIMRMGIEFLRTGTLIVDRTLIDAYQLIAIKRGIWTKDQVLQEMDRLATEMKVAYEESRLPEEPMYDLCEELLQGLILNYHGYEY